MQRRNTIKIPLTSITAAFLLASCGLGGEANLGDDTAALHDGERGPSEYEPCADKLCGDRCTLCAPNDTDCVETDNLKYCDTTGECKGEVPECAAGQDCGSVTCGAGEVCCNESCGICTPPGGACTQQLCSDEGNGNTEDPCAGKACGDDCSVCQPGVPCTTELRSCDARGICGGSAKCADESPEYDPCANKRCGEPCTLCAPDDPECAETANLKYCDMSGACNGQVPNCSSEEVCRPGDTRQQDCNTCDCIEGEGWVCTDIACSEPGATCGAGGETCSADEYCAYQPGDACGESGESAGCAARPEACDLAYNPVCGCDGKTHGNACAAAMEGVGVRSLGECE